MHAPVGSFAANPFGLHDVLGNVLEWVLDPALNEEQAEGDFTAQSREGDGCIEFLNVTPVNPMRILRGAAFSTSPHMVRTTERHDATADHKYLNIGVRPARAIRTPSRG